MHTLFVTLTSLLLVLLRLLHVLSLVQLGTSSYGLKECATQLPLTTMTAAEAAATAARADMAERTALPAKTRCL